MNFPKAITGKIERGEVTLTIRPAGRTKPADRIYVKASQKGGIVCHIVALDVREMWMGEVTFKQARACGYRTTDDFKAAWIAQFDRPFMKTLLDMDDEQAREAAIARFERRHAGRRAHAIRFMVAVDTPRFMANQRVSHGPNDDGQYVASRARAIDDLECVDELTQRRYAERATKDAETRRASFKRDLEVERAKRNGVNVNLHTKTLVRVNGFHDRQARRAA